MTQLINVNVIIRFTTYNILKLLRDENNDVEAKVESFMIFLESFKSVSVDKGDSGVGPTRDILFLLRFLKKKKIF